MALSAPLAAHMPCLHVSHQSSTKHAILHDILWAAHHLVMHPPVPMHWWPSNIARTRQKAEHPGSLKPVNARECSS
jgi:hypothetical protein